MSLENIDFRQLVTDLNRHYHTFDENFQLAGSGEVSFILFGVTGAGKSTTVARALDKTSTPAQFRAKLDKDASAGERTSEVLGVHVGHSKVSTTIVPRPYPIGKHMIVDMPGFAEADPKNKIIIDLLQKCYLTRTNKFRILIVAEMGLVYESKMRQLRDGYHRALWRLLGDKYQHALPHLYFIMTKPEQAIEGRSFAGELANGVLDTMEAGTGEDSALFARMLTRMKGHHMVVDLSEDTSDSLMTKIDQMLKKGAQVNSATNEVPSFDIEQLSAGQNRLNELCVEQMKAKLTIQQEVFEKVEPIYEAWSRLSAEMAEATEQLRVKKKHALEELKAVKDALEAVVADVKAYPVRKNATELAVQAAKQRREVAEEKNKIFKKTFYDLPFINVRCDVAMMKKGALGGKKTYHIQVNADVKVDGGENNLILIMDYEANDETLRAHINNNDSLVPKRLDDVKSIKSASVLYNSEDPHNMQIGVERPKQADKTGFSPIIAKADRPFKVFIYTERSFTSTHYLDEFQDQFDEEVRTAEKTIAELEARNSGLDRELQINKGKARNLEAQMVSKEADVASFQRLGADLNTLHQNQITEYEEDLEHLVKRVDACETDEEVRMVGQVLAIFRANKIESNAKNPFDRYTTGFGPIWGRVKELRKLTALFRKSDMEEIMLVHGMGLMGLTEADEATSF